MFNCYFDFILPRLLAIEIGFGSWREQSLASENWLSCSAASPGHLSVLKTLPLPLSYCVIVPAQKSMEKDHCDGSHPFIDEQDPMCLDLKVFFKLFLVLNL